MFFFTFNVVAQNTVKIDNVALSEDDNTNKTKTWISKSNNLNFTMQLKPNTPIVDTKTTIFFELKN
ncbi:MAG: hypothetical protein ACTHKF_05445 [Candidatus Nitrosocosmicus sp.]